MDRRQDLSDPSPEAAGPLEDRPLARANGGALVAVALQKRGVRTLFTLTGGHISPILVEAKARGLRVIDVRDEKNAAFAADAWGRLSGVPGVAVVTAGPGVTNTLTALKNAEMAQAPLVVIGGAAATMLQGRGALQDIDQLSVVRPHVKWACKVTRVSGLEAALDKAFRVAKTGVPGPVFVECPIDLLYDESLVRKWYETSSPKSSRNVAQAALRWYLDRHVERVFSESEGVASFELPSLPDLRPLGPLADQAARLLKRAERPVLLVGSQAVADAEVAREVAGAVADLGVPTYLAGMARGLLGPSSEIQLRHRRRAALKQADLVILAGVPADFRLEYGRAINTKAKVIACNLDIGTLFKNRLPTLPVPADPGQFLIRLARAVGERTGRFASWLAELQGRDAAREEEIRVLAETPAPPMNPVALCRCIDQHMAEDALIVADGGDFVATAAYTVRARGPLGWLDPGPFGTLGVGAGFAMAAAAFEPSRELWLLYGDGAAGFSLVEMDTFARHGLSVIAVIGNDAGWTQIERDQVEILKDDVGCRLAYTRYDEVARGYGAEGIHLTRIEDAPSALQEAKAKAREGRPVVVNAEIGKTDFRKGSISM